MSRHPCELCMRLIGRPGHVPPHAYLVKAATLATASQGSAHLYRCERCRQAIVLVADGDDGHDQWKRFLA